MCRREPLILYARRRRPAMPAHSSATGRYRGSRKAEARRGFRSGCKGLEDCGDTHGLAGGRPPERRRWDGALREGEQSRALIEAVLSSRPAGRELGSSGGSAEVYSPKVILRGRASGVSEQIRKSGSVGKGREEGGQEKAKTPVPRVGGMHHQGIPPGISVLSFPPRRPAQASPCRVPARTCLPQDGRADT